MLTDVQKECIEMICQGTMTNKEIASCLGITDRVIYKWKNNKEFKNALDKRSLDFSNSVKDEGRMRMISKGQMAIDNIVKIANTAKSDKTRLEANTFIYEAIFGKPTTKIEDARENDEKDKSTGPTWEDIKSIDNVIDFKA